MAKHTLITWVEDKPGVLNRAAGLFRRRQFNIDSISVLKVNIEGGEYPLFASMLASDFERIDQIAVSFHDWMLPGWKKNTTAMLALLDSNQFSIRELAPHIGWYLATKERT